MLPSTGHLLGVDPSSIRLWRYIEGGEIEWVEWENGESLPLNTRKTMVLTLTRNTTSSIGDKTDDVAMAVSSLASSRVLTTRPWSVVPNNNDFMVTYD